DEQPRRRFRVAAVALQVLVESAALDQLHAEEVLSSSDAYLVDGNDVRMIESSRLLRLVAEAAHVILVGELPAANHLQSDQAIRILLSCLVDDAHAALGELLQQDVIAQVMGQSHNIGPAAAERRQRSFLARR